MSFITRIAQVLGLPPRTTDTVKRVQYIGKHGVLYARGRMPEYDYSAHQSTHSN